MNLANKWVNENYENILQWAKNSCQQWGDFEDVAHYAITTFLENPKAEELVTSGGARWFIVRIMLNSSRGKKSEYYRLYRPPHNAWEPHHEIEDYQYDNDIDRLNEIISGILEDLENGDASEWYMFTIFKLCMEQPKLNFSKLARETGIPRTSISNTYYETIDYIKLKLKDYERFDADLRYILFDYLNNTN